MERLNDFKPTKSQLGLLDILKHADVDRALAYGGSRSGKSVGISLSLAGRGFLYPKSKHGVYRSTLNTCRQLLFQGTFPEVMELAWPGYLGRSDVDVNKSEGTITFHNGSMFYFRGLDEQKTTRIRGAEYGTVWVNECNEIRDYEAITTVASRLNHTTQMIDQQGNPLSIAGKPVMLKPLMIFDCNPQFNTDWEAQAFKFGVNPKTGVPHRRPERWVMYKMNPEDNLENQAQGYLDNLKDDYEGIPGAMASFVEGEWRDTNPMAIFKHGCVEYEAVTRDDCTEVYICVDPTTTYSENSDECGIAVVGKLLDGRAVVLDDLSEKLAPDDWAAKSVKALDDWEADGIIYETNQGGMMVESTIRAFRRNIRFYPVRASKSKVARAEPVGTAYVRKKVVHAQAHKVLEAQMYDFENVVAKRGSSPDRVDAMVYGVTHVLDLNGLNKRRHGAIIVNRGNRHW